MQKSFLGAALVVLAFLGMADSWYLADASYTGTPLSCDLGAQLSGCNIVAQSAYAHILGIPLGTYGILFYGCVFILSLLYLLSPRRIVVRLLGLLALAGLAASILFVSIQIFLIKALCVYCLGSAAIDVLIFLSTLLLYIRTKPNTPAAPLVTPWDAPTVV
jgi:uncharacterized membrane protein